MGCAKSKIMGKGFGFNNHTGGPSYRFWARGSGCSKIEDISMHMNKRGGGQMTIIDRASSLSDQRLLRPEDDEHRQSVSASFGSLATNANSSDTYDSNKINNGSLLLAKDEGKELKKKECIVEDEEIDNNGDQEEVQEGAAFATFPYSPSFNVYVRSYNTSGKSEGVREAKIDNMKENKDDTINISTGMKKEQVMQVPNEDSSVKSYPTQKGIVVKSVGKTKKGKKFRRVIPPKPKAIPMKSILGRASSCCYHHRKEISSSSIDDNKPINLYQ